MSQTQRYKQARKDFEALEGIAELHDQQELDARRLHLMQHPTFSTAAAIYESAIGLWFREHGITDTTKEIAECYDI